MLKRIDISQRLDGVLESLEKIRNYYREFSDQESVFRQLPHEDFAVLLGYNLAINFYVKLEGIFEILIKTHNIDYPDAPGQSHKELLNKTFDHFFSGRENLYHLLDEIRGFSHLFKHVVPLKSQKVEDLIRKLSENEDILKKFLTKIMTKYGA